MDEKAYLERLQELWNKNWPENILREPLYPLGEIPMTEYLKLWAGATPDKASIIYYGQELTFGQLNDLSDKFASYLVSSGLKKGDRVAIMLPNCPQFIIAFYGILKCGCVCLPVNPMFKKAELVHELNDAEPRIILVLDHLYSMVDSVKDETSLEIIITTGTNTYLPETPTIPIPTGLDLAGPDCPGSIDFVTMLEEQSPEYPAVEVGLDDLAVLNYTGGTTGMPKGCEHTQGDMLYTLAAAIATAYDPTKNTVEGSSMLSYFPVFWIAGEIGGLLAPIAANMPIVLLARWDAEAVLVAIDRYKIMGLTGVVDSLLEIMDHPDLDKYDLSSLRSTSVSSFVTKLNVDIRKRWEALTGVTVRESAYGMTETHTMDTFTMGMQVDDMDLKSKPVFCGLPMPGTQLKIVDFQTGELKELGEDGEIAIKTPSLMKRYWRNPEATKRDIIEGWLHTGDIGMLDEQGYLHYLGRTKEMLKTKGMSVFPTEIEGLLAMHPAVEACAVLGKSDEKKGEIPIAFVQRKTSDEGQITEAELISWCRENMAIYKVPVIKFIEKLPLTDTGKINKKNLHNFL